METKILKYIRPKLNLSENVAIVGSSKSILNKKKGEEINKYKDVIRFNKSPIKKFESFVGSKTTIRVVNNTVFECHQTWNNNSERDKNFIRYLTDMNILIISPHKISDEKKKENIMSSNKYFFLENKLYSYLCIFYFLKHMDIFKDLLKLILNKKNFSVGFFTVILCIISGIKPTLYGFDLFEDMNSRSHFWETPGKPGKWHDLNIEHLILKKFLENRLIFLPE